MAKKKNRRGNALVAAETRDLAKVELSEADRALLHEIALNRRAILKIAQISLDHERRLNSIESAIAELSDEEPVIDIEKGEDDDEGED